MTTRKLILSDNSKINKYGVKLYQIKYEYYDKNDKYLYTEYGGWIESIDNIVGDKVNIYNESEVFGNAKVSDNVTLLNNCKIYGNVQIKNNAIIDNTIIYGDVLIYDDVKIIGFNDTRIYGDVLIYDDVRCIHFGRIDGTKGKVILKDNVVISGSSTELCGKIVIQDNVIINCSVLNNVDSNGYIMRLMDNVEINYSEVYGAVILSNNLFIPKNGYIQYNDDFLNIYGIKDEFHNTGVCFYRGKSDSIHVTFNDDYIGILTEFETYLNKYNKYSEELKLIVNLVKYKFNQK